MCTVHAPAAVAARATFAAPSAMSSSACVRGTESSPAALAARTTSWPSIPPAPVISSRIGRWAPGKGSRVARSVGPEVLDHLAVAALGTVAADRDQLKALGPPFERADDLRRNAEHVPLAHVDDLVVQARPA